MSLSLAVIFGHFLQSNYPHFFLMTNRKAILFQRIVVGECNWRLASLCNSITSFQYELLHSWLYLVFFFFLFSRLPCRPYIHWILVLRFRWNEGKKRAIFFGIVVRYWCAMQLFTLCCYILSPIHSVLVCCKHEKRKLCKFRWKLSFIFFLGLIAKCTFNGIVQCTTRCFSLSYVFASLEAIHLFAMLSTWTFYIEHAAKGWEKQISTH